MPRKKITSAERVKRIAEIDEKIVFHQSVLDEVAERMREIKEDFQASRRALAARKKINGIRDNKPRLFLKVQISQGRRLNVPKAEWRKAPDSSGDAQRLAKNSLTAQRKIDPAAKYRYITEAIPKARADGYTLQQLGKYLTQGEADFVRDTETKLRILRGDVNRIVSSIMNDLRKRAGYRQAEGLPPDPQTSSTSKSSTLGVNKRKDLNKPIIDPSSKPQFNEYGP